MEPSNKEELEDKPIVDKIPGASVENEPTTSSSTAPKTRVFYRISEKLQRKKPRVEYVKDADVQSMYALKNFSAKPVASDAQEPVPKPAIYATSSSYKRPTAPVPDAPLPENPYFGGKPELKLVPVRKSWNKPKGRMPILRKPQDFLRCPRCMYKIKREWTIVMYRHLRTVHGFTKPEISVFEEELRVSTYGTKGRSFGELDKRAQTLYKMNNLSRKKAAAKNKEAGPRFVPKEEEGTGPMEGVTIKVEEEDEMTSDELGNSSQVEVKEESAEGEGQNKETTESPKPKNFFVPNVVPAKPRKFTFVKKMNSNNKTLPAPMRSFVMHSKTVKAQSSSSTQPEEEETVSEMAEKLAAQWTAEGYTKKPNSSKFILNCPWCDYTTKRKWMLVLFQHFSIVHGCSNTDVAYLQQVLASLQEKRKKERRKSGKFLASSNPANSGTAKTVLHCQWCGYTTKTTWPHVMYRHLMLVHKLTKESIREYKAEVGLEDMVDGIDDSDTEELKLINCPDCEYVTEYNFHLHCHLEKHHSYTKAQLDEYKKTIGAVKEDEEPVTELVENRYNCPECDYNTNVRSNLMRHIYNVHKYTTDEMNAYKENLKQSNKKTRVNVRGEVLPDKQSAPKKAKTGETEGQKPTCSKIRYSNLETFEAFQLKFIEGTSELYDNIDDPTAESVLQIIGEEIEKTLNTFLPHYHAMKRKQTDNAGK